MPDYKSLFVSKAATSGPPAHAMRLQPLRLFLLLPLLLLLLLPPGQADSRVCPDGCDYSRIGQALNASAQDETITVCSGVYSDPLLIAKRVKLHGLDTGEGKPALTPRGGRIVLAASGAVLSGFRISPQNAAPAAGEQSSDSCALEVILPASIFFNDFSGLSSVCPEDTASWNSSDIMSYQFSSRVLRSRLGNYWGDYNGTDEDGDGIGDQPMVLNDNNIDYHPLMQPVENYKIPEEKEIEAELIRAKVGTSFTISLPSNPTTGYTWTTDYDNVLLRAEDAQYEQDATDGLRVGAGGTAIFVFTPLRTGKTTIRFVYKRPWENIVADTRAFYVDIRG